MNKTLSVMLAAGLLVSGVSVQVSAAGPVDGGSFYLSEC